MAVALTVAAAGASCAHQAGKSASTGFAEGLRESRSEDPQQQVFRVGSGRAVAGMLEAFDDPAQKERLRALVALVAADAVRGAFGAMGEAEQARMRGLVEGAADQAVASAFAAFEDPQRQRRLGAVVSSVVEDAVASALQGAAAGPNGERGPAAALAGQIASAATEDMLRQLRAGLATGLDRRQLHDLTREAGAGFSAGVLESIKWPLLLATGAFGLLLGLLLGLLAHRLWTAGPRRPAGHGPLTTLPGHGRLREAGSHHG